MCGFSTAAEKQRIEVFVSCGVRLVLYGAGDPIPIQLADNNDDNFFNSLLRNSHQVLKQLLPDKTHHQYNLRFRRHDLTLSVKTDARNCVVRQLFIDVY